MIYDAECEECGHIYDYSSSIAERDNVPACPQCGSSETRKVILSAPMGFVHGKFEAFRSMVDGTIVRTKKELEEHNRRNSVVNLHDGYDEATIVSGKMTKRPELKDKDRKSDIQEAIEQVKAGYKPNKVHEDE